MKNTKPTFKQTYFLTEEQIRNYKKWSAAQIFEWLETTNDFLNKCRTPEAKVFNAKLRRGDFD